MEIISGRQRMSAAIKARVAPPFVDMSSSRDQEEWRSRSPPEARLAAAEANGYKRGAHTENDKKKDLKKYDERVPAGQR